MTGLIEQIKSLIGINPEAVDGNAPDASTNASVKAPVVEASESAASQPETPDFVSALESLKGFFQENGNEE